MTATANIPRIWYCHVVTGGVMTESEVGANWTSPAVIPIRARDEAEAQWRAAEYLSILRHENELHAKTGHIHCFAADDPRFAGSPCESHTAIREKKIQLARMAIEARGF